MKKWLIKRLIPTIREHVNWKDAIQIQDVTVNGENRLNIKISLLGFVIVDQNLPNPGGVVNTND